ncbi:MAG: arabinogalactan endo-beta-1,4-galactanase, partial [Butyrivibrio sp.]
MKKKLLLIFMSALMVLSGCHKGNPSIKKVDVTLDDSASGVFVEAVKGLPDDFILGCDVSSIISEENSGVKYYNNKGEEQDLLLTLAENGVNTIRIRIWNDPYNADGKGYGGGNNDVKTAVEIGKRATMYGMKSMIDFHYSDFWADPAKQMCPKAWVDMSAEEKCDALYQYTYDSLKEILEAGIEVNIVQVGNETTTGLAGCKDWTEITALMSAGCRAVRELSEEYKQDIKIALHFTNPENTANYRRFAKYLNDNNVDYDIFASSYYPAWHGTLDNLTSILSEISEKYQKEVMVAEFSYAYTLENGDNFANSISEETNCAWPYASTIQGQANCIRDIAQAVVNVGDAGIGICYWEPAWLPVPGDSYEEQLAVWEENGSGWASSYSTEYDPDDAGV